jgi:hypothetical protein
VRIDEFAFGESGLQGLVTPSSVEVLDPYSFCLCNSLLSVSFESISRLTQIEGPSFLGSGLHCLIIPSSVEVLAGPACVCASH